MNKNTKFKKQNKAKTKKPSGNGSKTKIFNSKKISIKKWKLFDFLPFWS